MTNLIVLIIKSIKAVFFARFAQKHYLCSGFQNNTTMAKKKTELEQLLDEFKKAQKTTKNVIARLEKIINQQARQIKQQQNELEQEKESKDALLINLLGENADRSIDGYDFERHVAWWMNMHQPHLTLEIWQGDKFAHPYIDSEVICPLWNKYPDQIYFDENKKEIIAIECKYRYDGILEISHQKYEKYKSFESCQGNIMSKNVKVYIMAGSRGTPDRPDYMYCIPLECFEKQSVINLRDIPQYKMMERIGGVFNYPENYQF